jgi:hypothetical protein
MQSIGNEWRALYKIAFFSTILMIILIPIQIVIFAVSPPPSSAEGFFTLYSQSKLRGLLSLDLLYLVNNALIIPLYLALGVSLKHANKSLIVIAMAVGFVGLAVYFPSNPSFEMLKLSGQYAAASDAQRQALLSSADSMLAIYSGTAFDVYYVFNAITLLLISLVMLKSTVYSRITAIIGLVTGFLMIIPSTAGTLGLVFSVISLLPWVIFTVMISKKFLILSKE